MVCMLSASGAMAQADENPDGLTMELNVLGVNSFGNIFAVVNTGAAAGASSVIAPSAAVGWVFGANALLLNFGMLGFGPGTNIALSVNPLFRHFFTNLQKGSVSPFVQGGLSFAFLSPAFGSSNWLVGLGAGGGAEWLFIQNLGLIVDVMLQYGHAKYSAGFGGGGTNIDVVGFAGNVGITVHW